MFLDRLQLAWLIIEPPVYEYSSLIKAPVSLQEEVTRPATR